MSSSNFAVVVPSTSDSSTSSNNVPPPAITTTTTSFPPQSAPMRTTVPSIKLDNIKPLRGLDNYETWASQVLLILLAIGAKSLVLTGITPPDMAQDMADNLMQQALLVIIQLVSEPIMAQIATFTSAHEMWVYLRDNYYADTCFSFVHQMQKIFSMQNSFDSSRPIGDFIRNFEHEWSCLHLLASASGSGSGSTTYRTLMKQVLDQDEAKRDWLLAALVQHHPNLVDNMTTKDNLTFSQLKIHLHSLSSGINKRTQNTALVTYKGQQSKNNRKRKFGDDSTNGNSVSDQKAVVPVSVFCTWCKSRGFRHEGHIWQDCRKLRTFKGIPGPLIKGGSTVEYKAICNMHSGGEDR